LSRAHEEPDHGTVDGQDDRSGVGLDVGPVPGTDAGPVPGTDVGTVPGSDVGPALDTRPGAHGRHGAGVQRWWGGDVVRGRVRWAAERGAEDARDSHERGRPTGGREAPAGRAWAGDGHGSSLGPTLPSPCARAARPVDGPRGPGRWTGVGTCAGGGVDVR
jgi:hypothetical protein